MKNKLSISYISSENISQITDYFCNSSLDYLFRIGLDKDKIPSSEEMSYQITMQLELLINEQNTHILVWYLENVPIGHCNLSPFKLGDYGSIHFHIWNQLNTNRGFGKELLNLSISYFFDKFELKTIYSEPLSLNLLANKLLESTGFTFEKEYATIPGDWSFYQKVKRWKRKKENILIEKNVI